MSRRHLLPAFTLVGALLIVPVMAGCTVSVPHETQQDGEGVAAGENGQGQQADDVNTGDGGDEGTSRRIDFRSIEKTTNFRDGVAWVLREGGSRTLIDLDGTILYEPDEYYREVSPYCEGVSLVWEDRPDTARLIDKTGRVVWSVEEDGHAKAEELYGADAVNGVEVQNPFQYHAQESWRDELWHGYTIVEFDIDSFEYTGVLAGLLGPDGTWAIEPPTIEDAAAHSGDRDEDLGTHGYGDSGEYGRYSVSLNRQGLLIYRTGEVLPYTGYDHGGFNGRSYGGMWRDDIDSAEEWAAHRNCKYVGAGRFEDKDGNVVMELGDEFPLYIGGFFDGPVQEDSFVDGEYCLVYLENEGGGKYFTVIDMQGNRMFDPMRAGKEGLLRGGLFFHMGEDEETDCYYTVEGDPLGDVREKDGTPFYEGRAWINVEDNWRCIDESGNIVF